MYVLGVNSTVTNHSKQSLLQRYVCVGFQFNSDQPLQQWPATYFVWKVTSERVAQRCDDIVDKKRVNSCVQKKPLFGGSRATKKIAQKPRRRFLRRELLIFFNSFLLLETVVFLAGGSIGSNPHWFELTGFRPESNRGPADNPNLLSSVLFSTELWWRIHHRRSFRTLLGCHVLKISRLTPPKKNHAPRGFLKRFARF